MGHSSTAYEVLYCFFSGSPFIYKSSIPRSSQTNIFHHQRNEKKKKLKNKSEHFEKTNLSSHTFAFNSAIPSCQSAPEHKMYKTHSSVCISSLWNDNSFTLYVSELLLRLVQGSQNINTLCEISSNT